MHKDSIKQKKEPTHCTGKQRSVFHAISCGLGETSRRFYMRYPRMCTRNCLIHLYNSYNYSYLIYNPRNEYLNWSHIVSYSYSSAKPNY